MWFFENLVQNRDYRKFGPNMKLSKISIKPEMISENFDKNRDFQKLWLKSRLFENFDHCWDFDFFFSKTDIFENFHQNRDFFLKLWQNPTFFEILTKIEHLVNFEQNRDFRKQFIKSRFSYKILTNIKISNRFDKISIFSKTFLTRMEVFEKIFTKMNIFENLDQNPDFPKIWTKRRDFWKFYTKFGIFENIEKKSGFSIISIKLRIFLNSNKIEGFYWKFPIKWRFIENFDPNRDFFRKFRPKSFENFD